MPPWMRLHRRAKFGSTKNAAVVRNWVHDNHCVGLWMDTNNTGFRVEGNLISGNAAEGLLYDTSYNALIRYNSFVRNAVRAGPKDPDFPRRRSTSPSPAAIHGPEAGTATCPA